MIGPLERHRVNFPARSFEHAYSSIVISFPEIALNELYRHLGRPNIPSVAQPLKKEESKEKKVQKGLDNNGNIEGFFIFLIPEVLVSQG
jgi:hypothetical protein